MAPANYLVELKMNTTDELSNSTCTTRQGVLFSANILQTDNRDKFPLAPMGVIAPGSAHARPSARPPIDNLGG